MSQIVSEFPVDQLSVEEKLTLLGRLWDSILDQGPPPIPNWHRAILQQRIQSAEANPEASISLEELRTELHSSRQ